MSESSSSEKQTRRRYSDQFKRDAVGLVTQQGYSLAEAARSLDVHVSVIRNWKEKFGMPPKVGPVLWGFGLGKYLFYSVLLE